MARAHQPQRQNCRVRRPSWIVGHQLFPVVRPGAQQLRQRGPALLVARPGGTAELWLPADGWYDLWSGARHEGGRELRVSGLKLDRLPVFGRKGHVLPLGRAVQHTGEIDPADPVDDVIAFGMPVTPSAPGIAALWLEAGRLVGATRVRGFGRPPVAEPGGWRFRPG